MTEEGDSSIAVLGFLRGEPSGAGGGDGAAGGDAVDVMLSHTCGGA
jgi:hypothetical protein